MAECPAKRPLTTTATPPVFSVDGTAGTEPARRLTQQLSSSSESTQGRQNGHNHDSADCDHDQYLDEKLEDQEPVVRAPGQLSTSCWRPSGSRNPRTLLVPTSAVRHPQPGASPFAPCSSLRPPDTLVVKLTRRQDESINCGPEIRSPGDGASVAVDSLGGRGGVLVNIREGDSDRVDRFLRGPANSEAVLPEHLEPERDEGWRLLDANRFELERAPPRARRPDRWLLAPTLHALLSAVP